VPVSVPPKTSCVACDCEKQKAACSLAVATEQATQDADLGRFYLDHGHYQAAYAICQDALKLASSLQPARFCLDEAIIKLREERRTVLSARLAAVDAHLWRGEVNDAFTELGRIRADLAPSSSLLGDFDGQMNQEMSKRLDWTRYLQWWSWFFATLPSLLWKLLAFLVLAFLVWLIFSAAFELFQRHKQYRTRKLESARVDWTVWSIRDDQNRGAAGPVMDALNPESNPLLSRVLKPSSLLLVPDLAVLGRKAEETETLVWRDFLDSPRDPIDMERLPLEEIKKHRFIQIEAFEELDVKVAGLEAKGLMGLIRTFRKWLDRGLPAAQGTVYTLTTEGTEQRSYACVRITCNWTSAVKALSSPAPRGAAEDEDTGPQDMTLSVFASSVHDPSIDAVALSAQRAAFKLFHRLATKSSPTYASAVANFHQGVELIDEYI
jgi:hypothetical protein